MLRKFALVIGILWLLVWGWRFIPKPSQKPPTLHFSSLVANQIGLDVVKPGEYVLVEGDENCLEGELRLVPGDRGVSLMVGAHALVLGLGEGTTIEEERECRTENTATFSKTQLEGTRLETCRHGDQIQIRKYHTLVEVFQDGLSYRQWTYTDGRLLRETKCRLIRDRPRE